MQLDELKVKLEIAADDTSRDEYLQDLLDAAIDEVQTYCNQDFVDPVSNQLDLPPVVKHAVKIIVQGMDSNEAIQADSIGGGMSKTLIQGGYIAKARQYLKKFRKIKVIQ